MGHDAPRAQHLTCRQLGCPLHHLSRSPSRKPSLIQGGSTLNFERRNIRLFCDPSIVLKITKHSLQEFSKDNLTDLTREKRILSVLTVNFHTNAILFEILNRASRHSIQVLVARKAEGCVLQWSRRPSWRSSRSPCC